MGTPSKKNEFNQVAKDSGHQCDKKKHLEFNKFIYQWYHHSLLEKLSQNPFFWWLNSEKTHIIHDWTSRTSNAQDRPDRAVYHEKHRVTRGTRVEKDLPRHHVPVDQAARAEVVPRWNLFVF